LFKTNNERRLKPVEGYTRSWSWQQRSRSLEGASLNEIFTFSRNDTPHAKDKKKSIILFLSVINVSAVHHQFILLNKKTKL